MKKAAYSGERLAELGPRRPVFVHDKQFYATFFKLSMIVAAQNLVTFSVNLADNIMLGRFSETTLAGAAMVSQIQFLLQMMCMSGIGTGALVIVSQYWGKGEVEPIRRIIALAAKFAIIIGLLFSSISFFMPAQIVGIFTNDSVVIGEGAAYLRIMAFTFLIYPLEAVLLSALRGVRIVVLGTVVSLLSLGTNIVLNYMLIFGNWGAPRLGIEGAALATLAARFLEFVIVLVYIRLFDRKLRMRLLSFFKPDFYYLSDFVKSALPVLLSGISWGIGMMLQVVILGHMSKGIVAANSIAATVYQVITTLAFGQVSSTNVIIGNTIGEGKLELIRPYTRTIQVIFVLSGAVCGLLLFLLRDLVLAIYILEPATHELAHTFITLLCIVAVFAAYQFPAASGIVLGGGNTRYPVIVETSFIWLCVLPFSALSAFVWKFPAIVTFLFLKSDQFLKCIPNGIVVNRYRWVRILTRE